MRWKNANPWRLFAILTIAVMAVMASRGQSSDAPQPASATSIPELRLIQPEALVRMLKANDK